jgi:pimeloyl-ACP methyl ester carboxylesterase
MSPRRFSRFLLAVALLALSAPAATAREHVILLHGLCRSSASMEQMQSALTDAGYVVHNLDYPSRTAPIAQLADDTIAPALATCHAQGAEKIHFVTHSLGGLLVRSYFSRHPPGATLGRVVMLGPPNQGSEVADKLGDWALYRWINGPAGQQLGTAAGAIPQQLGAPAFPVGIIAGNHSINWINSLMLPGSDDGKVSVEKTKLAGMTDHLVLPATHPYLMKNRQVIAQAMAFLQNGRFDRL